MNRTLFALWAIILGSIMAIVALVVVSTSQRETQARLDLAGLLRAQLVTYNRDLTQLFQQYDRQLQQALEGFDPKSPGAVLTLERSPLCALVVVVGDDGFKGRLWHPPPEQIEVADRSLVEDAVTWIRDSNFVKGSGASNSYAQASQVVSPTASGPLQIDQRVQKPKSSQDETRSISQPQKLLSPFKTTTNRNSLNSNQALNNNATMPEKSHWTTWYHGRGLVLAYWTESLHQTVTMVIIPRGRWLSDLIAALPDNGEERSDSLVQLVDVEGATISQWGNLSLVGSEIVDAEIPIDDPLEGWRLRMMLTPEARASALGLDSRWLRGLVAAGFSLALILLGSIITININRQLRLAEQQVSFVNQVSHELRTPLTNIRMYTDLALQGLEPHRDAGLDRELDRLTVIQHETTRLGRLIENVLAFARSGKPRPVRTTLVENVEGLIDDVLATFEPQLKECQMEIERAAQHVQPLRIDREAFEQILVNLISNAIKYAASGRLLRIETAYSGQQLTLRVIDHGPGIPKRMRQRVFEPFVRGSNRLEDPAGTGIGLSIARQLARQHGGDCRLLSTPNGCTFEVSIKISGSTNF